MGVTVHTVPSNCNVIYFNALGPYEGRPEDALVSLFTTPFPYVGYPSYTYAETGDAAFRPHNCGYLMFHLGSEHKGKKYASQVAEYIKEKRLGVVSEQPPAPNPLHAGKPGILFIWTVDWAAVRAWWDKIPVAKKRLAARGA